MKFPVTVPENPTAAQVAEAGLRYLNSIKRRCTDRRSCVYQQFSAGEEERCVAGAFFPNGHPALKDTGTIEIILVGHKDLPYWMHMHSHVLSRLQAVHDAADHNVRRDLAESMKAKHGLDIKLDGPLFRSTE